MAPTSKDGANHLSSSKNEKAKKDEDANEDPIIIQPCPTKAAPSFHLLLSRLMALQRVIAAAVSHSQLPLANLQQ